jgi:hypothetical protein
MRVLRKTHWSRRTGYLGSFLCGQLTEITIANVGVCYVRENFHLHSSFLTFSSARLGIAGGVVGNKIRPGINPKRSSLGLSVLELCAPSSHWTAVAEMVATTDKLCRPVLRNRAFTKAWAKRQFTL